MLGIFFSLLILGGAPLFFFAVMKFRKMQQRWHQKRQRQERVLQFAGGKWRRKRKAA